MKSTSARLACGLPLALALVAGVGPAAGQSTFYGFTNNLTGVFPLSLTPEVTAARDSFVAAVGASNVRSQNFDGLATGAVPSTIGFGTGLTATFVSTAVSDGVNPGQSLITSGVSTFQEYPTSGSNYLSSVTNQGTTFWTMTFSQAIGAVGFYMTDPSDWFASAPAGAIPALRILAEGSFGTVSAPLFSGLDPAEVRNGSLGFFGIVATGSNSFDRISIEHPSHPFSGDAIGIDDMMVALAVPVPVPEPETWAMLVAGLGVLLLRWRRKGRCIPAVS
jgi:hypothetical protein